MKTVIPLVLMLYLGLAPIYWLPGISFELLGLVKIILFVVAAGLLFLAGIVGDRARLPTGLLGPAGLGLSLLATTGGIFQSEMALAINVTKDYLLVFSTLWMFYLLAQMNLDAEKILIGASTLVALACVPVFASKYLGGPDFAGPPQFVAEHLWISGFSSLRTGWSNGIALYVAPLLLVMVRPMSYAWLPRSFAALGVCAIILSQITVAGRAGMLASLLVVVCAFAARGYRKVLMVMAVAVAVFVVSNLDLVASHLRITRDYTASQGTDDIDTISAGRLQGDIVGIERALESPLIGHGLGEAVVGGGEIHNVWIRLANESGVLAPLVLLAVVALVSRRALFMSRQSGSDRRQRFRSNVYIGVIFGGLVMTMLEPRVLLGTFQISVMWWAFAGLAAVAPLVRPVREAGLTVPTESRLLMNFV